MDKQIEYTEAEKMRRLGRAMVYLIDVLGADDDAADGDEYGKHSQLASGNAQGTNLEPLESQAR